MSEPSQQARAADGSDEIPPGPEPGVVDERVASNLRTIREQRGMSQADLAAQMTSLGWRYHPQTVHKIESGQRKVTIGEAEALARIFRMSIDRLTWLVGEDAAAAMVDRAIVHLRQAWREVSTATARLEAARFYGERTAKDARASEYKRAREAAGALEGELADGTLESAIEDGIARWEDERAEGPGEGRGDGAG